MAMVMTNEDADNFDKLEAVVWHKIWDDKGQMPGDKHHTELALQVLSYYRPYRDNFEAEHGA